MRAFLVVLLFCGVALSETINVAVASSMRPPVEEIAKLFEKLTGHKVRLSFGSSGLLYRKVLGGAPYDVFLPASDRYAWELVERGKALGESLTPFAKGELVVFALEGNIPDWEKVIKEARRVAIPNPRYAPYGVAALEFLKRSGLYEKVRSKLVNGSNVGQAFQFVVSGGADVGLVSLSLAVSYPKGRYVRLPRELYNPVIHVAVITSRGREKETAHTFVKFLKSEEARKILNRFGFEVP